MNVIIKSQSPEVILAGVSLANLTTFRVGGLAQWYASPRNWQELEMVLNWYNRASIPLTVLGAGSNLLVSDRGIKGLVVTTRYWRYPIRFDVEKNQITVAAGEPIPRVAWLAAKRGWQGLEWAVGIPGSVGGAVVMNAGAQGGKIADCLLEVKVISPTGELEILSGEMLNYGYRHSCLQNGQKLVLEATFQLQPGSSREEMMALTSQNLHQRKNSQPYDRPSCGSVFRNPTPYAAGWLIEQTGLKGYQIGQAQVAQRHANFILNCGGAKAMDIWELIAYIQAKVQQEWAIALIPEVKFLGEFC
ncbi:MAG: UDP-N-acetylmuramate dehydrogenase [Gloeocapsa sp. DLM2.Bin57]|nr:MAG: UDP-N-acetylmuramate dehydrogenase [Gloeocapsa sp. DLM2.Bin57]